ncbi:MAG: bacteriophage abortive infection AbiH family protein [Alistipes sp.]|nr:bacteriophage abortive infection AbiH family protein [Alistipes sp.]
MNRIVLIGNGFDKAHGLPTGYKEFMDSYWTDFSLNIYSGSAVNDYEDEFVTFHNGSQSAKLKSSVKPSYNLNSYTSLIKYIGESRPQNTTHNYGISFKNNFWKHITQRTSLNSWLDIENEYYYLLKSYLKDDKQGELVRKLNEEFSQVKKLLEKYLTNVSIKEVKKIDSIEEAFRSLPIHKDDVGLSKLQMFWGTLSDEIDRVKNIIRSGGQEYHFAKLKTDEELDEEIKSVSEEKGIFPMRTLFLNFNYTSTVEKLYLRPDDDFVINIHGELNNPKNPIIFGYGDELDDDYKDIEKTNDNNFMENMKHIHYSNTDNYRALLMFLQQEPYQVFVMGHSCGNSDRTLLQTIFEHTNCVSIKPFYYQWKDAECQEIKDNYTEICKNISRNFNDKKSMRDILVNKVYCKPLSPIS